MDEAAFAFDADFRARAPTLDCRPERTDDRAFVAELFVRCSPLTGSLPDTMVLQQAQIQFGAFAAAYPHAMRRIATRAGEPIGRLIIDWNDTHSHMVDVAVLPEHQKSGTGTALLQAWLAVSDGLGKPARLNVRFDNPAVRLYMRLGFVAAESDGVFITMLRPAGLP